MYVSGLYLSNLQEFYAVIILLFLQSSFVSGSCIRKEICRRESFQLKFESVVVDLYFCRICVGINFSLPSDVSLTE